MQTDLPGHDLIAQGLDDLVAGAETAAALLVSIGAPACGNWPCRLPIRSPVANTGSMRC